MSKQKENVKESYESFRARAQEVARRSVEYLERDLPVYVEFEDLRFLVEVWYCVGRADGDFVRVMVQEQIGKTRDLLKERVK